MDILRRLVTIPLCLSNFKSDFKKTKRKPNYNNKVLFKVFWDNDDLFYYYINSIEIIGPILLKYYFYIILNGRI